MPAYFFKTPFSRLGAVLAAAALAAGCHGETAPPPAPPDDVLIAARIRRLTSAELDRSVAALLGSTSQSFGAGLAPDVRQHGFTANAEQRVDSVLAGQIASAAEALAAEAVSTSLAAIVPCAPDPDDRACAAQFIDAFGAQAFRRPLVDADRDALLAVYDTGREGAAFEDGVRLVVSATLQAASFLYLTELGGAAEDGVVTLTPWETAASLSYLLTGGPPDDALVKAAASGALSSAAAREREARRLLREPSARAQVRRFVEEWLGIVDLARTSKSAAVYPEFDALRPSMKAETDAFIDEVVWNDDGAIATLLGADYTMADEPLASFYGVSGGGADEPVRVSLDGTRRRGILTHASFLATAGKATESAPIKRGVIVLRRVLCQAVGAPPVLEDPIVPPPPDPGLTTRERFEAHTSDPGCRACHRLIDPIGFAFEGFDGIGAKRATENGKPVVTDGVLDGTPIAGPIADAADLAGKLAASEEVASCFARNAFRFGSAQGDAGTERTFLAFWEKQPREVRVNVVETLVAFVRSELFVKRKVEQ